MTSGSDNRPPYEPFRRWEGWLLIMFFVVLALYTQFGWLLAGEYGELTNME